MLNLRQVVFPLLILLTSSCKKEKVTYDHSFDYFSPVSGHEYHIQVLAHPGTGTRIVFYVLDPKDLLPYIQDGLEELSPAVPVTFVGIGYKKGNHRSRDLTFTSIDGNTGKGAAFLEMITAHLDQELITRNIIPADAVRGVMGHSLGGLFAAHCFSREDDFFDRYIILSPALFYDNYDYFGLELSVRDTNSTSDARIYLGVGRSEDLGMNNSFEAFKEILQQHYPQVHLRSEVVDGSHYDSRGQNIFNGLQHTIGQ